MTGYALALLLTLAIEVPVQSAVLHHLGEISWRRAWRAAAIVNLVSHPLAFLVAVPLLRHPLGETAAILLVEVGVMVGEAWGLSRLTHRTDAALIAAALANSLSLTVGVLLF